MGNVITFYSYKGGTGRSMALANVSYLLSLWGYKVLMVDWDLEAPGLQNFFCEYINENMNLKGPGVVDILTSFKEKRLINKKTELNWEKYIIKFPLNKKNANLHFLPAGETNDAYYQKVRELDIDTLYSKFNGGDTIERLRNEWKENYDFIMLDSRTGITDIGGICTIQMPDILILLFTATRQSLNGAIEIFKRANDAQKNLIIDRLRLLTIPIPSRFDSREEFKESQKWNDEFSVKLKPMYKNWLPTSAKEKDIIEVTKIPYSTYFSFGEKLSVIEQNRKDSGGLAYSYENIAALIANNVENVDVLLEDRDRYISKASNVKKRKQNFKKRIFISYTHKDKNIFDRIMVHLKVLERFDDFSIWTDRKIEPGHDWYLNIKEEVRKASIVILLLSADYISSDFIMREELPGIFEREIDSGLKILPVIVRPCAWNKIPFINEIQVFPEDGNPLSMLKESDLEAKINNLTEQIASISERDNNLFLDNPKYIFVKVTGVRVPTEDGGLLPKGRILRIPVSSRSFIKEVATKGNIPIKSFGHEWFIFDPLTNKKLSTEDCSDLGNYFKQEYRNLELKGLSPD